MSSTAQVGVPSLTVNVSPAALMGAEPLHLHNQLYSTGCQSRSRRAAWGPGSTSVKLWASEGSSFVLLPCPPSSLCLSFTPRNGPKTSRSHQLREEPLLSPSPPPLPPPTNLGTNTGCPRAWYQRTTGWRCGPGWRKIPILTSTSSQVRLYDGNHLDPDWFLSFGAKTKYVLSSPTRTKTRTRSKTWKSFLSADQEKPTKFNLSVGSSHFYSKTKLFYFWSQTSV